jgi:hypothetical protein
MEPLKLRKNVHEGPEAKIQAAFGKYLREREWYVISTHGNQFQKGLPDDYATHEKWKQRWIEYKVPTSFSFTPEQVRVFPKLIAHGTPIWIITEATDAEYEKLFKPCNFFEYFSCFHDGCRNIVAWRAGRRT